MLVRRITRMNSIWTKLEYVSTKHLSLLIVEIFSWMDYHILDIRIQIVTRFNRFIIQMLWPNIFKESHLNQFGKSFGKIYRKVQYGFDFRLRCQQSIFLAILILFPQEFYYFTYKILSHFSLFRFISTILWLTDAFFVHIIFNVTVTNKSKYIL